MKAMNLKKYDYEWSACTYTGREVRKMIVRNIISICISVAAMVIAIISIVV